MSEPTKAQLEEAARQISGCHCSKMRQRDEELKERGIVLPPRGMTHYNGELLHRSSNRIYSEGQ